MLYRLRFLLLLLTGVLITDGNAQKPTLPPTFVITTEEHKVYLTYGADRFMLQESGSRTNRTYWVQDRGLSLPDGRILRIDSRGSHPYVVRLLKGEQEQARTALEEGPRFLDSVVALGDSAFAILNGYSDFKSMQPIEYQLLVRIRLHPSLAIEPVRGLQPIPQEYNINSVGIVII